MWLSVSGFGNYERMFLLRSDAEPTPCQTLQTQVLQMLDSEAET
jgi:hypothetical protein